MCITKSCPYHVYDYKSCPCACLNSVHVNGYEPMYIMYDWMMSMGRTKTCPCVTTHTQDLQETYTLRCSQSNIKRVNQNTEVTNCYFVNGWLVRSFIRQFVPSSVKINQNSRAAWAINCLVSGLLFSSSVQFFVRSVQFATLYSELEHSLHAVTWKVERERERITMTMFYWIQALCSISWG